jgi:hypothetical protein
MLVEEKLRLNPQLKLFSALVSEGWQMDFHQYDYEKAINHFYEDVKCLENPESPWYNNLHFGDCSGHCCPCIRCQIESNVLEAEQLMEKFTKL